MKGRLRCYNAVKARMLNKYWYRLNLQRSHEIQLKGEGKQ